jgi:sugar phosphate isomerase/epimerase
MPLGFVSAILPEMNLEQVLDVAADIGFDCVELMCWPKGKADRRYAGVTHIDVAALDAAAADRIASGLQKRKLTISGLGYYPNLLSPDADEAKVSNAHLRAVIAAAKTLHVPVVNTFIGRNWRESLDANWERFRDVWPPLIRFAEEHGVRIAIENCPMLFTADEWPGGKNLAVSPAIWRRMFSEIPSEAFGLNYDPSHLVWQGIDAVQPLWEFRNRIFHAHAKDVRVDPHRLNDVGILAAPLEYHTPKLPGLGDVNWGRLFSVLGDVGYRGPVCVEVEDRAYEGSVEDRIAALSQSFRFLRSLSPSK